MIFHTATGEWRWIQARGTAPNQISTELVAQAQKASPTKCQRYSARLMIVPGLLAGLWTLHSRYGRLPWQTVCQDAQDLAQVGFQADTMLSRYTTRSKLCNVDDYPLALHPPVIAGRRICQTRLAATLLHIAEEPRALYQGTLAEQICAYVERAGSIDCRPDFDAYRVHELAPRTTTYRGWRILFPGLPHIGALQVVLALHILEHISFADVPFMSSRYYHLIAEAIKLSFATRAQLVSICDTNSMLAEQTAATLCARIRPDRVIIFNTVPTPADHLGSTSHISIGDADGNVIALTQTVGRHYGGGLIEPTSGIVLNDLIGDFSLYPNQATPHGIWHSHFNVLQPAAIPASSQAPILAISPNQEQIIALGAASGPKIISAVTQTLVNRIDYGLDVNTSVQSPRIHTHGTTLYVENRLPEIIKAELVALGHKLKQVDSLGQLQLVQKVGAHYIGASDQRGLGSVGLATSRYDAQRWRTRGHRARR